MATVSKTINSERSRNEAAAKPVAFAGETTGVWFWSAIGVFIVAISIYFYSAWITGPYFKTNTYGREAATAGYVTFIHCVDIGACIFAAVLIWIYMLKPLFKTKIIPFDGILLLAGLTLFWQEPFLNFQAHLINYSTWFVNFGSWDYLIPGWKSPNPQNIPCPVLFAGLFYMYGLTFVAMLFSKYMGWLRRRMPQITELKLILLTALSISVFDFVLEQTILRTGIFIYGRTVPSLSLFAGTQYQFPIYENLSWMACYLAIACVRYYRNEKGETFVDKGIDKVGWLKGRPGMTQFVRWLTLVGYLNLAMFLTYNLPYLVFGTEVGPQVKMPAYLDGNLYAPDPSHPVCAPIAQTSIGGYCDIGQDAKPEANAIDASQSQGSFWLDRSRTSSRESYGVVLRDVNWPDPTS